jgi:hypothetical protein
MILIMYNELKLTVCIKSEVKFFIFKKRFYYLPRELGLVLKYYPELKF